MRANCCWRDDRVRRLIEPLQGSEPFNFLLTTTPDPNNPLYGKRVVNVLISTPDGYLTEVPQHLDQSHGRCRRRRTDAVIRDASLNRG